MTFIGIPNWNYPDVLIDSRAENQTGVGQHCPERAPNRGALLHDD